MNDSGAPISDILSGRRSISLSLHVAGGIIIGIIILTCCCTLFLRNKCARIIDKLTGRKKKEKYPPSDIEEGRKKKRVKKLRRKRKRTLSPELVEPEVIAPIIPREPERSEDAIPCYKFRATIDVNLSELEYLAARLDPFECRRLIAALHYTTYDLPKNLAAAERKVDEEIPCLRQLLHWNSSPGEGRGKTHAAIVHRLRQLNRNDLADWLGKTAFKQLGKDVDDAIASPFEDLVADEEMETITLFTTTESVIWTREEDAWLSIDTFFMALMLGLLGTLLVLIVAIIVHAIKSNKN